MFCKNVGGIDRVARFVLGAALVAAAFLLLDAAAGAWLGVLAIVFGAVFITTALIGFCPLYCPFKLSTCAATPANH